MDKDNFWVNTIIDGITFKDNVSTNGRVLYLRNSVTLQNCQILDNACTGTVVYGEENTIVRDCYFSGNTTSNPEKEVVTLQLRGCHNKYFPGNQAYNCLFEGNLVTSLSIYNTNEAGGVQEKDEDGTSISNCIFRNNKAACLTINNQFDKRYLKIMYCLFEDNVAAPAKDAGLVLSGSSLTPADFAFNIIRNNANTSTTNWRNCIVSARGKIRLSNNLIVNNSSDNLLVDLQGNEMYNCTVANNKGTVYVDAYSTLSNSIVAKNEPTHKDALICAAKGSYVEYCASNEESKDDGDQTVSFDQNIVETNFFVAPTDFVGVAKDDAQKDAIKNADFSLAATSACVNAGEASYYQEVYGMTAEWMEEFMSKDIAGNARIVDGKINMGAYQGGKGTGINTTVEEAMNCNVTVNGAMIYISSEKDGYATLYNVNGAMIASTEVVAGNASIPAAQKGLYLVKVVTGNQAKTFKVVIK